MFKSAERKRSQGFTLAEVLIVVAIIGILLAVAIPNVISYYRSLKLTELDDSAKTIFMAAQSRLTAMTSAGQDLYDLSDIYVAENAGISTGKYLAVTSARAGSLASLVPGGSIESQLYDNHYVVEIDPKTGAVYAVWYWEKEDFKYTNDAYVKVPSDKGERLKKGAMVGYYGGSEINRPELGQMPIPQLTVINAEELRLEIRIPDLGLDSSSGFNENNIRVSVLVNGKTIIDSEPLGDVDVKDTTLQKNYVGKVILDTLKSGDYTQDPQSDIAGSGWNFGWVAGAKFEDWVKDNDIVAVPGDDINVTVVVSYLGTVKINGKDTSLVSQSASVRTNSLFASVKDDGGDKVAEIAYGRHLQNLDTATSGATNTITAAEQTRSIDFNDSTSVKDVYSWADTYGSMFKPIENTSLTSYNGHEYEIRNLNIQENISGYLGLFGFLSNYNYDDTIKFEKIILVNTKSEEGIVGALVGGLGMNGYIDDCHVYLDEIGADGKLLDPSPRLKGSSVGGLVGVAYADLTMTNCSAATVISSAGNAGGLVSNVGGVCKISKSYAACNLTGAYVGGLVGLGTGGVTIQNSYAAGTADVIDDAGKARKVAGLVNWADGTIGALPPDLTSSYAAVRYGKSVTDARASNSLKDFFGACEIKAGVTVSDLYYVKQAGITYEGDSGVALSVSELKGKIGNSPFNSPDWYVPDGGATVNPRGLTTPYKVLDSWLADPYPYPMLANNITAVDGTPIPMPHYGDWLENSYATSFYWENEKDSAGADHYHFYLVMSDGATKYVADGLCPDHHLTANMGQDIDAWGYGLIGIDATAVNSAGLDSFKETNADVKSALETFLGIGVTSPDPIPWEGSAPGADTLKGITDLLSDASNVILLKGASEDKFSAIETGAGWLELNLGFAAAIDVTENTGTTPSAATNMGKTGIPYQIRTVRQLDNIPNSDSKFYEQTHDLYGKDYDADTSNSTSDVYSGPTGFSGNYNGGSYRILELDIDSGLFTSLSGADLHDIILYSPTGEAKNTSTSGNVGGLAGSIQYSGKINNCVVAGYKLSVSSNGSHIGGLIGDIINTSTKLEVTNCAAVNTLSGPTAGGLVGYVTQGTVDISGSYAGGTVESNGYVGGIVGYVGSGYGIEVDYSDVYSYAKITNGFFVYGIGPQGNGSYNNCRYWTGGNRTSRAASDAATYGVTGVSLAQLESGVTTTQKAGQTYVPDTDNSKTSEQRFEAGLTDKPSADDYPYPAVVQFVKGYKTDGTPDYDGHVHYGEWPVIEASATYVEIYPTTVATNRYGVYGYLSDHAGTPLVNTLLDPTTVTTGTLAYAEDDCYGLLVPDGEPCPGTIPVNGGNLVPVEDSSGYVKYDNIYNYTPTGGSPTAYDFYRYRFEPDSTAASTNYYHSIKLNKQEFWVNLDYGCEVVKTAPSDLNDPAPKTGADGTADANSGTVTPSTNSYNGVVLRTARQLAEMAKATESVGKDDDAAQLRAYEQLLDIDYDEYTGDDLDFGKTSSDPQYPAALWRHKVSDNNFDKTGSYNGHGFAIKDLYIGTENGSTYNGVGLFGELGTTGNLTNGTGGEGKVQGIRLIDLKIVDADNIDNVGALAGNVKNQTIIENCGVYVSEDNATNFGDYKIKGKEYVGGLVGALGSSTTVKNSFAAVPVEGDAFVGGFVGQINGTWGIENCYSGGHNGNTPNVQATDSDGAAGGFVGRVRNYNNTKKEKADFQGLNGVLYSTCSVSGGSGKTGLFAGVIDDGRLLSQDPITDAVDIGGALSDITVYALGSTGAGITLTNESAYIETNLADILAEGTSTDATPYDTSLGAGTTPKSFPYLTAYDTTTSTYAPHYGDWPEIAEAVFYWEQEQKNSTNAYNFYAKVLIGDNVFTYDTLCDEYHKETSGHEIKDWGYGTFTTDSTAITLKNGSGSEETVTSGSTVETAQNNFASKVLSKFELTTQPNYKMYKVSSSDNNTTDKGKKNYYIDLRFGAAVEAVAPSSSTNPFGTEAKPFEIRTARQLDNIPNSSTDNFRQTHDVVYGASTTHTTKNSFGGTYDGGSFRIMNIGAPLFGNLTNTTGDTVKLHDIILYSPDGSSNINATASGDVGGLARSASGTVTITNCAVAGYNISGSGSVGGLVGKASGSKLTVTNCAAVNTLSMTGSNGVGGLVGALDTGATLDVTTSYAGGSITNSNGRTGGIVGSCAGTVTCTNVYSYVNMSNISGTPSGCYGIGPTDTSGTYSNCCYWRGGVTGIIPLDALVNTPFSSSTELTQSMTSVTGFGKADETYGKNTTPGATDNSYPFPAVVQVNSKYVHYGDWPNP